MTDPTHYVQNLRDHLQSIHASVSEGAQAAFERRQSQFQKRAFDGGSAIPSVGDFVFVRWPPAALQSQHIR